LVLNRKGRWVPIDDAVVEEEELLLRLARGQIPVGGEWVDVGDPASAGTSVPPTGAVSTSAKGPVAEEPINQDTSVIDVCDLEKISGRQLHDSADTETESDDDAPAMSVSEHESDGDDFDSEDEKDFEAMRPDTVRLELDLDSREEAASPQDDSQLAEEFSGAEPDTWEHRRMKRTLVIVVAAASVCAVAAAILIYLQFFR
jgi:hypothetical protein